MNTIRSIVSIRSYRIPPRLKLLSTRLGSLILLFQRMPVVQFLFPEANIIGGASVANTISLAVTTVVGLGVFDSVAGQTTINEVQPIAMTGATSSRTTAANAINVPATVSASLTFEFLCGNAPSSPESWRIVTSGGVATSLPTGLAMKYQDTVDPDPNSSDPDFPTYTNNLITGTPAQAGIIPVYVRVYRYATYSGENVTQRFNICVLGFTPTGQPLATQTIPSGSSATLTFTATGIPVATTLHNVTPTVTYQWYSGASGAGSAISGASGTLTTASPTASYTTPNDLSGNNSYWVKVTSTLSGYSVSANSTTAVVNVTPVSSPFDTWASDLAPQNGPMDNPQGDGVTNLEKFAFNMNRLAPDVRRLTVGAGGTAGLPGATLAAGKLRMEFLRRKFVSATNPGITYTPQFCSNLGTWENFTGSPVSVTDVLPGTDWERVVVDDPNSTADTKRFGRVKVIKTP